MSETREDASSGSDELIYLRAIAALLAASHKSNDAAVSDEASVTLLLDSVGLSFKEIAKVSGRQPDAVRMAITRAKKSRAASQTRA
jgi:DNA-directed RNA polymerase specialized sigma24 family protein